MSPHSVPELVGLALACGAADVGGPLSKSELRVVEQALPASKAQGRSVRAAIREGADPLGDAFCKLRCALERRPLGAFYTGALILSPMIDWALQQRPERLVDPGCGSGRFSVAAAKARRSLTIIAVDLDPVATLLTRAALAAVGAKRARVLQADYLRVAIPRQRGRTAFVGNPPYVRHHDLDAKTKARATELAEMVGHEVSGLAGLHALFYLVTLAEHGARGDIGTFVTSAEWLDVGYGSVIRSMFTNGLGGRSLTVIDPQSVPFDDAMTTAAITTFRIGDEPRRARVARVTDARAIAALETVGRDLPRELLAGHQRWSPFLRDPVAEVTGDTIGTHFRVSRGQVTGKNDFFVMTRELARARGIERFCVPLVTSADEVFAAKGVLRDGPERLVGLELAKDLDLARLPRLARYLASGEAAGVHRGYVASHRSPWWSTTFPRPPIVATYMARQAPVFAINPDGLGLLNVAHGLHPRRPMSRALLTRVVRLLNASREQFVGRGRTYHGGLEKFEPGEMEALPLALQA
jgi:methylase of polypeptide subunit release factors